MRRRSVASVAARLQAEMERSMKTLGTLDPTAYYMGYIRSQRTQRVDVSGSHGGAASTAPSFAKRKPLALEVRYEEGSTRSDNSHKGAATRKDEDG